MIWFVRFLLQFAKFDLFTIVLGAIWKLLGVPLVIAPPVLEKSETESPSHTKKD